MTGKLTPELKRIYENKLRKWSKEAGVKKKNKFNASASKKNGRTIHSELERSVDAIYELRERAGELRILARQDAIDFYWNGVKIIRYIPDFKLQNVATGEIFWGEAKGFKDALWSVKEACWRAAGPGRLEMWEGDAARPIQRPDIIPKKP